jgi:hypothetical protein
VGFGVVEELAGGVGPPHHHGPGHRAGVGPHLDGFLGPDLREGSIGAGHVDRGRRVGVDQLVDPDRVVEGFTQSGANPVLRRGSSDPLPPDRLADGGVSAGAGFDWPLVGLVDRGEHVLYVDRLQGMQTDVPKVRFEVAPDVRFIGGDASR